MNRGPLKKKETPQCAAVQHDKDANCASQTWPIAHFHLSVYQKQLFVLAKRAPDTSPSDWLGRDRGVLEEQWVVWAVLFWMWGMMSCVICNLKLMFFVAMGWCDLWAGRGGRHAKQSSCSLFRPSLQKGVSFQRSQKYFLSARKNGVTVVHLKSPIRPYRC